MIGEIITLFFVMLAVTMACFLGMFAAEGLISKMMPTAALYGATLWMTLKTKTQNVRERISGWWHSATTKVNNGFTVIKGGLSSASNRIGNSRLFAGAADKFRAFYPGTEDNPAEATV